MFELFYEIGQRKAFSKLAEAGSPENYGFAGAGGALLGTGAGMAFNAGESAGFKEYAASPKGQAVAKELEDLFKNLSDRNPDAKSQIDELLGRHKDINPDFKRKSARRLLEQERPGKFEGIPKSLKGAYHNILEKRPKAMGAGALLGTGLGLGGYGLYDYLRG